MHRVLVLKAVAATEDYGTPCRPIARGGEQDLPRGRGERPRGGPIRSWGKALQIDNRAREAKGHRWVTRQELHVEQASTLEGGDPCTEPLSLPPRQGPIGPIA